MTCTILPVAVAVAMKDSENRFLNFDSSTRVDLFDEGQDVFTAARLGFVRQSAEAFQIQGMAHVDHNIAADVHCFQVEAFDVGGGRERDHFNASAPPTISAISLVI